MSFIATADELKSLAQFLEGLSQLSALTGVKIAHYDSIQITTREGTLLTFTWKTDENGFLEYLLEERCSS